MLDFNVVGNSLPDAYHEALVMLHRYQNHYGEIAVTMVVEEPLREPRISRCFPGGFHELEQYRQEILDGILDFEVKQRNWHYTYHQRYAPYLQGCIDELRRDPNSRRAVISIRDNDADMSSTDPACLQSIQFMIRYGKLNMYVYFRSNDGVGAAFMNAFALIELQKKVADELGIDVGTYTHRANSFHVYPGKRKLLASYVKRIEGGKPVTYRYEDSWEKLMADERPAIAAMVEEQRRKIDRVERSVFEYCWLFCFSGRLQKP